MIEWPPANCLNLRKLARSTNRLCTKHSKKYLFDEKVKDYVLNIVALLNPKKYGLRNLESLITIGASPRASIALIKAAKAHAFIRGRGYVTPEDVKQLEKMF